MGLQLLGAHVDDGGHEVLCFTNSSRVISLFVGVHIVRAVHAISFVELCAESLRRTEDAHEYRRLREPLPQRPSRRATASSRRRRFPSRRPYRRYFLRLLL
jgi:hypothetical protein